MDWRPDIPDQARTIRNWIEHAEQRQQRPSAGSNLDAQCHTNLLKSSWILEEAVIARGGPWSRRARRFIRDLCSVGIHSACLATSFWRSLIQRRCALSFQALDIDLERYLEAHPSITQPGGTVPLFNRVIALTERRLMDDDSCKNDVISPDRFLAVNLRDCGLPLRETVLYRT